MHMSGLEEDAHNARHSPEEVAHELPSGGELYAASACRE